MLITVRTEDSDHVQPAEVPTGLYFLEARVCEESSHLHVYTDRLYGNNVVLQIRQVYCLALPSYGEYPVRVCHLLNDLKN